MKLTKKQKNCPYCHLTQKQKHSMSEAVLESSSDGEENVTEIRIVEGNRFEVTIWWYGAPGDYQEEAHMISKEIHYCPMCGRPL